MTHFIYSTHTNATIYVEWDKSATSKNYNIAKRKFLVAGGHGLNNKNLITPCGIVTRVDRDEDLEWLMSLPSFNRDIEKGFIRVSKRKEDPERIVKKDMNPKDGSAPKTPSDFKTIKNEDGGPNTYKNVSVSATL